MGFLDFLKPKKKKITLVEPKKKPRPCFFKLFWMLDMIEECKEEYGITVSVHRVPVEALEPCEFEGLHVERPYGRGLEFWATAKYKKIELYTANFKTNQMPQFLKERIKKSDRALRTLRIEDVRIPGIYTY